LLHADTADERHATLRYGADEPKSSNWGPTKSCPDADWSCPDPVPVGRDSN